MQIHVSKGDSVKHSKKDEWGLGKVIEMSEHHAIIFFLGASKNPIKISTKYIHLIDLADPQEDPRILHLPSDEDLVKDNSKNYMTFEVAEERFKKLFPFWFEDEQYLKLERKYKWDAHELMEELLNNDETHRLLVESDFDEFARRALKVVGAVNLLSPYENMALNDAVKGEREKEIFSRALAELLHSDEAPEVRFNLFSETLFNLPAHGARLHTWPVQTIFPYIMFPEKEMFLKPGVTQEAAKRLAFQINYRSEPNWLTYSKLLMLADILFEKLAKYKPQDFIDIQSFIWYVSDDIYDRFGTPAFED